MIVVVVAAAVVVGVVVLIVVGVIVLVVELSLLKTNYCWDPWCAAPSPRLGRSLVFIIFVRKPQVKGGGPDPVVLLTRFSLAKNNIK